MAVRAETNTLSGTTADTVTLAQAWPAVSITNHDATTALYFRLDGAVPVSEADENGVVLPGATVVAAMPALGAGTTIVKVVGNGNKYTVEGVN
jgi:hypothetical protein